MPDQILSLRDYLARGVEHIVKGALKASLSNPKESIFMAKYARASKKFSRLREQAESSGEHIPPFLIASITSSCNLHCAGCYSRGIDSCSDFAPVEQLDGETWGKLFQEAASLGIGFIFLAGGEPLMRKDVILKAAECSDILFPVITNGTLLRDDYLSVFDRNRNLVPVISIEGGQETTDLRRGAGIYQRLENTMSVLKERGILFGVSVTVTKENLKEVTSREFAEEVYQKGCHLIILIEYVAVTEGTDSLAPGDQERAYMDEQLDYLRTCYEDMLFIAFPGDEKESGGCLAAGRGFFHINSHGGAEPCPFSPYSDVNVRDVGLAGALQSGLFQALKDNGFLTEEHEGGCALFQRDAEVRSLMEQPGA